ncbi:MAG TPA: glycosyltransferase family 87 protein [Bryobacterales bacterium]|jgi:hypothetical protein|nr:glycosyltransferase family 87 protein [Bryobacterales bacterium]
MLETALAPQSEAGCRLDAFSGKALLGIAWLAAVWIFLVSLAPAFSLMNPSHSGYFPPDYMQFYMVGRMAAAGDIAKIYDKAAYEPLVRELRSQGERIGDYPFNRPSFEAFACIPLSWFSYRTALLFAFAGNLAVFGLLLWKLPIWFGAPAWTRPCLLVFTPFLYNIALGQDVLPLALLVASTLRQALLGRDRLAGILLGLCCFKPHLVWLLPMAPLVAGRRRMFWSFAATAGALAALSIAALGTAGLRDWILLLRSPFSDYMPETMCNWRGLARHLGPAPAAAAAIFILGSVVIILCRASDAEKVLAALVASLLLSPHTYHYDYALLAVAAMATPLPAVRILLLLPWSYFHELTNPLPWIALAIVWLGSTALPLLRRRVVGEMNRTESLAPAGF